MAGNLQLISVIEAINFVLLWKGNHLDTHACKDTHTYINTLSQIHVLDVSHKHIYTQIQYVNQTYLHYDAG